MTNCTVHVLWPHQTIHEFQNSVGPSKLREVAGVAREGEERVFGHRLGDISSRMKQEARVAPLSGTTSSPSSLPIGYRGFQWFAERGNGGAPKSFSQPSSA